MEQDRTTSKVGRAKGALSVIETHKATLHNHIVRIFWKHSISFVKMNWTTRDCLIQGLIE